jgi:hypothetical protein
MYLPIVDFLRLKKKVLEIVHLGGWKKKKGPKAPYIFAKIYMDMYNVHVSYLYMYMCNVNVCLSFLTCSNEHVHMAGRVLIVELFGRQVFMYTLLTSVSPETGFTEANILPASHQEIPLCFV